MITMVDEKISIITVCFNCEELIERTINSVIDQTYANIQYVVIDGGSTDNTLNIIKKYKNRIDVIISEKDDGIYDAMNKGLEYATGDLIYFLNAGDYLCNKDVLEGVIEGLNANPDSDIVYGDQVYYDDITEQRRLNYYANIPQLLLNGCCHQTIFARKSTFTKCGSFDSNYKVYGDLDWLLRVLIKFKLKMTYIDVPIAYYLKGGISETNRNKHYFEWLEITQKNLDIDCLLYFAVTSPYSLYRYLMSRKRIRKIVQDQKVNSTL